MKKITTIFYILFLVNASIANEKPTQNIRGKVLDADSQQPLIGVSLMIAGSDPIIGTTTGLDGSFRFDNLPVGRYAIISSYLGYEPGGAPNILLGAGKEAFVTIKLVESFVKLDEIAVTATKNKDEALNKMASVSARSFSVAETQRYAGGLNDPSRMASSYAGVAGSADGSNDIIIRGNSPKGLLWRMEGIEIPNPNHFASEGTSGGPIGILNGNMLAKSDFFTSAFPAEYGNAYSGVFDINLRNGNNQKREYSLGIGVLGTDCSVEGPFKKGGKASYLFNYRYSSLALLQSIGIEVVEDGAVPKYQDLSLKLHFPTEKAGTFSVFGLGGDSRIEADLDSFAWGGNTKLGVLGVTHNIRLDEKTFLKTTTALTGTLLDHSAYTRYDGETLEKDYSEEYIYTTARLMVSVNRKLNNRNTVKAGIIYSPQQFDLTGMLRNGEFDRMDTIIDDKGGTALLQSYMNWRHRLTEELTITSGVHYMHLMLNNNWAVEPRFGAKWQFSPKQSVNAGVGLHSRISTVSAYYASVYDDAGNRSQPNKDLDFARSIHYVIGYSNAITPNLVFKSELYYQSLYNVPVENDPNSAESELNMSGGYSFSDMVNDGTGRNYGLEMTLEKFFANNYYFTGTASIFESKYTAKDGVERNTAFNNNYVFNALGGKEFILNSKKCCRRLSVSTKATWAGGSPFTPIDLAASIEKEREVYDNDQYFSERYPDFIRFDLKLKLSRERKKTTQSWELDIQNVTNRQNTAGQYYDAQTERVETYSQMGLLPVINYRIEF